MYILGSRYSNTTCMDFGKERMQMNYQIQTMSYRLHTLYNSVYNLDSLYQNKIDSH